VSVGERNLSKTKLWKILGLLHDRKLSLGDFSEATVLWVLYLLIREKGGLICRFWGTNIAAVLRWHSSGNHLHVVGRSDVATGWQKTEAEPISINITNDFEGGGVVEISLDIRGIQKLTF
jgi:hypothetical protein